MSNIKDLKIKIFADGAELPAILELAQNPIIKGFTTNPTLMRKAGVIDYAGFAKEVLAAIPEKPFSFEVFSDDFEEMARQAYIIASWGPNVYVKIPITNTKGEPSCQLIERLAGDGIKLNVTAVFTQGQVEETMQSLWPGVPAIISIFAGRIADTGVDPAPVMETAVASAGSEWEILWASPRHVLDIFRADAAGVQIITVTSEILAKLGKVGYDLTKFSLDTVKMFYDDAVRAGYKL